ncbi:hypothetical protein D3C80_1253380 [compost metagenome]
MGHIFAPHDSGDGLKGRTDKAIARGVNSQLVESTGYQAAIQQLVTLGSQNVDAAPNTIDYCITRTVAKT